MALRVRDQSPINELSTTVLTKLVPTMPEDKRGKLANASTWDWHESRDFNQGDVFERKFREIAGWYYAEGAGRDPLVVAIAKLFAKYKPIIEAFVKEFTYSTEKVNGQFMGDLARGASEVTLRPLVLDSFGTLAHVLACANYWQLPAAGAENHIIPDNVRTAAEVAAGRVPAAFAHTNRRAWLILGYAELVAGVQVYDSVQEWINDSVGFRKPLYNWPQLSISNILLMQSGCPLYVETGEQFDLDGWATAAVNSGIWPIGVEAIVDPEIGLNLTWPTAAEH